MAKKELYKLRDPGTMLHDAASGFTLRGGEEKALPSARTPLIEMSVRSGRLIRVETPAAKGQKEPDTAADNNEQKADD